MEQERGGVRQRGGVGLRAEAGGAEGAGAAVGVRGGEAAVPGLRSGGHNVVYKRGREIVKSVLWFSCELLQML